jgi:uncharacterized protein YabN with tetrapyrrole methylase and pyrophosphatase domain
MRIVADAGSEAVRVDRRGSLVVVGTGIRATAQLTLEALEQLGNADVVLTLVPRGPARGWIESAYPNAESLGSFYGRGVDRLTTYLAMAEHVMSLVRAGRKVCLAAYGHPGVYALPTHLAVRMARAEGYPARMLPGVSAEACLFADLGVDPAQGGYQSYESLDFLVRHRRPDPYAQLVLWQIGIVGMVDGPERFDPAPGLRLLTATLRNWYPADHPVTVYEAAVTADGTSRTDVLPLAELPSAPVTRISTLYVPALGLPAVDETVLDVLGVSEEVRRSRNAADRRREELFARTAAGAGAPG